jgi:hypothetical protein
MKFKIDKMVIKKTKCPYKFKCLNGKPCSGCATVLGAHGEEQIFVKPSRKNFQDCSYTIPYGSCYLCRCPTRVEIFRKYKV